MRCCLLLSVYFLLPGSLYSQSILRDQPVQKVLIINSFDAQTIHARKNKKALFVQLADSLKSMLKVEFGMAQNRDVIIIPELVNKATKGDSIYSELLNKYAATKAIIIKNLDAYFEQTGVEVTKEADGKKRVASYDLIADVTYTIYDTAGIVKETETRISEFFTTRNVISGFFAAGPDIVGKSKYVFEIIKKNAQQYRRQAEPFLQKN